MILVKVFPPAGLLSAVGDPKIHVEDGTMFLSWTPPFTFDLTNVDPDIEYYVEITKHTIEGDSSVIPCTACPLSVPQYNFTLEASPCDREQLNITIIPINGAGNGASLLLMHQLPEGIYPHRLVH